MLKGCSLSPMRRVAHLDQSQAIPFPAPGSNLSWGDRLTFDASPITDPFGEHSTQVYVVRWDGKEVLRVDLDDNHQMRFTGSGPVWPIRPDQWAKSHACVGAFVIEFPARDAAQHKLEIECDCSQGLGSAPVKSNVLSYLVKGS